jgi:release factor glutamine methyltransferase
MSGQPAAAPSAQNVRHALRGASARLQEAGCDTARLDAELLLGEVLGVDRGALARSPERPLTQSEAATFEGLVARRVAREPIAYVLGRRWFRNIELSVDPRVLVPRPETELLVEEGLSLPADARVVDVGTGSGAIALALKQERPDMHVTATDVSGPALELARANAQRLGLEVEFVLGDLFAGVRGRIDAVLSNPPYVAERDRPELPPELAHEPEGALFAGGDGLGIVRRLVTETASARIPVLAIEIGRGQADATVALYRAAGFSTVRVRRDLAGIDRVVTGRLR